ncbi:MULTISPECIES: peptidoglycan D,D-transpeptidase FtsI family protein [Coprococcus]|jgi:stage V sporulation protein D (sporulation-specific penicillin-binding protein)|uniref:peptidoglycan D,D-transpeptidase FtsI family protein n=1 Tax=Coprococcus TaxID=33042 RepID=UPI000E7656F5|nr:MULTISPECIES: penicillin-binding protein 2 [Coprococcus]RJW75945.1 penicillin-binding protein 2 [Coprococcus sp. AF38-1]
MSKRSKLFLKGMRRKTKIAYLLVVGVLVALTIRVVYINVANGKEYSEAVVLQMDYNSTDIPYERGEILDRNGNVLANSEKTYSLILEPVNILITEKGKAATRAAVLEYFDVSGDDFDKHIANEDSYYEVVLKDLPYTKVKAFEDYCKTDEGADVIGVRFETVYKRNYPNGSLACHLLGYTASGNVGQGGIEGYYNDYLNGVDGKTYRYMSGLGGVDSETVAAQNGETVVSTIDMNIQKIIEDNITEYMQNTGAKQIGIIAMDPNNGEILGMASSRTYDPNDPMNTQALRNMTVTVTQEVEIEGADENADSLISVESAKKNTTATTESSEDGTTTESSTEATTEQKNVKTEEVEYDFSKMSDEEFHSTIDGFTSDQLYEALNYVWQNYCISDVFEPGSTYKAFTIAGAMEDGVISDGDEFLCDGSQVVVEGESPIYCSYRAGHGMVDVKRALAVSCNDALMQIADKEGPETFDKYQVIFNIGSKTGIDLEGETTGIKYDVENLNPTELATSSFGQGVTTSMIQMAAGFCSVINGGNYYVPHVVKRLLDSDGNVVENMDPVLVRKTISKEVSDYMKTYLQAVVEEGTGYAAGIEGYTIGGKTGTAEKLPRGNGKYVLSFIGFTPVENPQIMLYVVVDEPHVEDQSGSGAGAKLFNQVMQDLLPYLNVYSTNGDDVAYDGTEEPLSSAFDTDTETADTEAATEDAAAEDTSAEDTSADDTSTDDTSADDTSYDDTADDSYTADDTWEDDSGTGYDTDTWSGDEDYSGE